MTYNDDQTPGTLSGDPGQEQPLLAEALPGPAVPPAPPPPPRVPGYGGPGLPTWQPPAAATHGPPPRRGGLSALWVVLVLLVLGAIVVVVAMFMFAGGSGLGGSLALGEKVGVVSIEGVITDGGRGGLLFGSNGARATMDDLRRAGRDDSLKAVVLLINSPGGSAAASHAIYQEIIGLREDKIVVACMTDVAASGGYYVASACDKIVAQGSTLTGSIGVIYGGMSYYGLMQRFGVTDMTQTAGKYKDTGSSLRPMRPDERALLQAMLDDVYSQFIAAVAAGRKMTPAKVRAVAEGRVYTGRQAQAAGLVDELGNFYDAVALAGKLAGIRGEPKVEYLGQPTSLFGGVMGAAQSLRGLAPARRAPVSLAQPPMYGPMLVLPWAYETMLTVSGLGPR